MAEIAASRTTKETAHASANTIAWRRSRIARPPAPPPQEQDREGHENGDGQGESDEDRRRRHGWRGSGRRQGRNPLDVGVCSTCQVPVGEPRAEGEGRVSRYDLNAAEGNGPVPPRIQFSEVEDDIARDPRIIGGLVASAEAWRQGNR